MKYRVAAIAIPFALGLLAQSLPAAAMDGAKDGYATPAVAAASAGKRVSVIQGSRKMTVTRQEKLLPARSVLVSTISSRLPDGNVEFCSGPGHQ